MKTKKAWQETALRARRAAAVAVLGVGGAVAQDAVNTNVDFDLTGTRTLTIQSGKGGAATFSVVRPKDAEGEAPTVTFSVDGERVGSGAGKIAASFGGTTGRTLNLTVGADVPVGWHTLTVHGRSDTLDKTLTLRVFVERWLLVDDDRSNNNWPANNPDTADSNADKLARAALQARGKTFDVKVVPYSGSGQDKDEPNGPSAQELARYSGVLWYTGNTIVRPVTDADRASLTDFLNLADRRLVLISPGFVRDASANGAAYAPPRSAYAAFFTTLVGLDRVAFAGGSGAPFTLTGEANMAFGVTVGSSARAFLSVGSGAQALLRQGTDVVVAGRKRVGTANSSTAVLGAFSLKDVSAADGAKVLDALLTY